MAIKLSHAQLDGNESDRWTLIVPFLNNNNKKKEKKREAFVVPFFCALSHNISFIECDNKKKVYRLMKNCHSNVKATYIKSLFFIVII